jgi:hypothetical protein
VVAPPRAGAVAGTVVLVWARSKLSAALAADAAARAQGFPRYTNSLRFRELLIGVPEHFSPYRIAHPDDLVQGEDVPSCPGCASPQNVRLLSCVYVPDEGPQKHWCCVKCQSIFTVGRKRSRR